MTQPGMRAVQAQLARAARLRERRRAQRRRRHAMVWWTLAGLLVATGAFAGGLLSAPVDFTEPAAPKSALLLDRHGQVFAAVRSPYQREEVPGRDIPSIMRQAIVSAEDRTFYKNSGVDPLAMVRAAYKDLTGSQLQGGSTITQQYVKQVYTNQNRNLLRKVREAALAVRLERRLSKQEILTRYLNTIYFGQGTYGVQAASKYYFGVPVKDLALDPRTGTRSDARALARASMLAGIVDAPSAYNPVANEAQARARQLYVLNRMIDDGVVTAQQASDARGRSLPRIVKKTAPQIPTIAAEFRDYVISRLKSTFNDTQIFEGGLRVRTTLDLDLQKAAVDALHEVLPSKDDPEAAVIAIDPRNGDIRAMTTKVSLHKQHEYKTGGFNLATQATRSTGSTIKPFTLSVALQHGYQPDSSVCAPSVAYVPNPGGTPDPYPIHNAEGSGGCYSLRSALWSSVNTVYGPLALKVGLKRVLKRAVAAGLGPKDRVLHPLVPAKAIGGGLEVTPISEATAYSTLLDHGVRHDPRSILTVREGGSGTTTSGHIVYSAGDPRGTKVMPRKVADTVTDVMRGVVDYGTARSAQQPFPVYGKTGTTNDETDAWFVGCTHSLCIATWMGYDKLRPMQGVEGVGAVFGGTLPAAIFAKTWDDYRTIKATRANGGISPTPSPHSFTPPPSPTPSTEPKPSPSPKPEPTQTTAPRPTPSPTRSRILPFPGPSNSPP